MQNWEFPIKNKDLCETNDSILTFCLWFGSQLFISSINDCRILQSPRPVKQIILFSLFGSQKNFVTPCFRPFLWNIFFSEKQRNVMFFMRYGPSWSFYEKSSGVWTVYLITIDVMTSQFIESTQKKCNMVILISLIILLILYLHTTSHTT